MSVTMQFKITKQQQKCTMTNKKSNSIINRINSFDDNKAITTHTTLFIYIENLENILY